MSNEEFFNKYQTLYPSLQAFQIQNNTLIYEGQYQVMLNHLNLSMINNVLFLLEPNELYQTIYLLELFYKNELTKDDETFIKGFVTNYLNLNDLFLANQTLEENRLNALSIPIYTSYNEGFMETPCGKLIQEIVNNHTAQIESSEERGPKLVLKNSKVILEEDISKEETADYLERTGFTVFMLVAATIVLTSIYIAFFIFNN